MASMNSVESIPGNNFMAPLTRAQSPILLPLYAPDDAGAGGGTGGGGEQPGAGGGNPNPNPNPGGGGQSNGQPNGNGQPGGGNAGGGGERTYSYKEDRTDWVPRSRLNEQHEKLNKQIQELKEQVGGYGDFQSKLRQAFGVEAPTAEDKELGEIREAIYKVIPGAKVLEKLDEATIERILAAGEVAQATTQSHWERHAETMLTTLESEVAQGLGLDKLTPTQQKRVRQAYREEARDCMEARERAKRTGATYDQSNDFLTRHERGDKSLVTEVAKAFLDDFAEPARRQAAADATRRFGRPVPRGERTRTMATTTPANLDLTKDDDFKKALLGARGGGQ